jgi:hypothetical protein
MAPEEVEHGTDAGVRRNRIDTLAASRQKGFEHLGRPWNFERLGGRAAERRRGDGKQQNSRHDLWGQMNGVRS